MRDMRWKSKVLRFVIGELPSKFLVFGLHVLKFSIHSGVNRLVPANPADSWTATSDVIDGVFHSGNKLVKVRPVPYNSLGLKLLAKAHELCHFGRIIICFIDSQPPDVFVEECQNWFL